MQKNYIEIAKQYAQDVISGKQSANRLIRLACERFERDLKRSETGEFDYYFDEKAAIRPCRFIEQLPHTKGKWARDGVKLSLEPWQVFFVCNAFGWLHSETGLRRFQQVLLFVPRKNGKSALAAGIGLYLAFADNEFGAEVYSGATTEKQAWEVFRPAKIICERTPDLTSHFGIEVNAKNLCRGSDMSRFEPMIGKPRDGASPHGAIIDEYHEHDTDHMVETMLTGMGAREQPMLVVITTAGSNLGGPCHDMQMQSQRVLEGVAENEHVFSMIFTADAGDNWADIEVLKKVNPNFGVSISEDFLKKQIIEAKLNSRKQATFKTKHLNMWVGAREAYFNLDKWKQCYDEDLDIEDFKGYEVFLGMDLASRVDIAAISILLKRAIDGKVCRFGRYYLPEARVNEPQNDHYRGWAEDGLLTVTDGEIIDFRIIKDDLLALCDFFDVKELAYDPHQATMLISELMDAGVNVVEMRQSVLNFSEPMKHLDSLIRSGNIAHDGDPVYTWQLANVVAKTDAKDQVYPRKEKDESKIDAVVADLMAINRMLSYSEVDINDFLLNPIIV